MFIILISFVSLTNYCSPYTLRDEIAYYELLDASRIAHNIVRRSVAGNEEEHDDDGVIRHLTFVTHGREYTLNLRRNSGVLADNFAAHYLDKEDGRVKDFTLDRDALYTGYVSDDYSSDAIVYMDSDYNDVITATIFVGNDTVNIEPLRKLVTDAPRSQMIVYKESNLKERPFDFLETNIDGHTAAVMTPDLEKARRDMYKTRVRARRSGAEFQQPPPPGNVCTVPENNLCPMYLVADYTFFQEVGNGDRKDTIYHMLQAIQLADNTFKNTRFDQCVGCKIGLTVAEVFVFEEPSPVGGPT